MSSEIYYIDGTPSKDVYYKIDSRETKGIGLSPNKTKDIHLDIIIDGVKYRYNPYIEIHHVEYHKIIIFAMVSAWGGYVDSTYYLTENDLLKYFEKVEENE